VDSSSPSSSRPNRAGVRAARNLPRRLRRRQGPTPARGGGSSVLVAMDEQEFRSMLELFPVVRSRDYCVIHLLHLPLILSCFLHMGEIGVFSAPWRRLLVLRRKLEKSRFFWAIWCGRLWVRVFCRLRAWNMALGLDNLSVCSGDLLDHANLLIPLC
jgi:hypothetical protein